MCLEPWVLMERFHLIHHNIHLTFSFIAFHSFFKCGWITTTSDESKIYFILIPSKPLRWFSSLFHVLSLWPLIEPQVVPLLSDVLTWSNWLCVYFFVVFSATGTTSITTFSALCPLTSPSCSLFIIKASSNTTSLLQIFFLFSGYRSLYPLHSFLKPEKYVFEWLKV